MLMLVIDSIHNGNQFKYSFMCILSSLIALYESNDSFELQTET